MWRFLVITLILILVTGSKKVFISGSQKKLPSKYHKSKQNRSERAGTSSIIKFGIRLF